MRLHPGITAVVTSPITEAYSWLDIPRTDANLVDVSQAVPGYPPPEELRHHLADFVLRRNVHGYTEQLGLEPLRAATAQRTARLYGATVETKAVTTENAVTTQNVGITAGCNQAFCLTTLALAGPGDEILLPLPAYFNHDMWLRMQGIRPAYVRCGPDQRPDLEHARRQINERTRAIVLVSPNNPTGAVYPPELLLQFFELARSHGLALIVDETYRDFRTTTERPHALFEQPDWSDTLVQLFSFSKVFCIPAHRTGTIVASPALLREVAKAMDCVAICPPRIGQEAALFGLRELASWQERNRRRMVERVELFRTLLAASGSGFSIASAGAYFAYVEHPFDEPGRSVARRLAREQRVLALCGEMFGPGQERYLRIAFANLGSERIPELVERLRSAG